MYVRTSSLGHKICVLFGHEWPIWTSPRPVRGYLEPFRGLSSFCTDLHTLLDIDLDIEYPTSSCSY